MPLVRYEIRSEYELANRELYRSAPKNDPEAILEGVAMVSLVGIVRQLGDLAEFAADIFHDLHEAVMATASRSHDLSARVTQLEAELPALEKMVFSKRANPLQFAYTPGVDWHASIRNDQNHCTQGDLPRFIRSSYEECRGPPRLFLLDKFDIGGVGACLKRYTDPSFFKMEWASSELMKAEKAQQDKKARKGKKTRRRKDGEVKESRPAVQIQSRMRYSSISMSSLDGLSESTTPLTAMAVDNELSNKPFPFVTFLGGSQHSSSRESAPKKLDLPKVVKPVRTTFKETDENAQPEETTVDIRNGKESVEVVDDAASEAENYLDAMTTMESETDSEPRDRRRLSDVKLPLVKPELDTDSKTNDNDACFEDARNSTMDSETEVDSKYSLDLTPMPDPESVQELPTTMTREVHGGEMEKETWVEEEAIASRERDSVSSEERLEELDAPLEPLLEPARESSMNGVSEDELRDEQVLSGQEVQEGAREIQSSREDEDDDVDGLISESIASSEVKEHVQESAGARTGSDDEPFDVEVIRVIGDDRNQKVDFEPLSVSDDDIATEQPREREMADDSLLKAENPTVRGDAFGERSEADDSPRINTDVPSEEEAHDKNANPRVFETVTQSPIHENEYIPIEETRVSDAAEGDYLETKVDNWDRMLAEYGDYLEKKVTENGDHPEMDVEEEDGLLEMKIAQDNDHLEMKVAEELEPVPLEKTVHVEELDAKTEHTPPTVITTDQEENRDATEKPDDAPGTSVTLAKEAHESDQSISPDTWVDEPESDRSIAAGTLVDEPEENTPPVSPVLLAKDIERQIEPDESVQPTSPVDDYESASSHEDFFMAQDQDRSSSRFSDFSDDISWQNEAMEIDEHKETPDGDSGYEDFAGNERSVNEVSTEGTFTGLSKETSDISSQPDDHRGEEDQQPALFSHVEDGLMLRRHSNEDNQLEVELHERQQDSLHTSEQSPGSQLLAHVQEVDVDGDLEQLTYEKQIVTPPETVSEVDQRYLVDVEDSTLPEGDQRHLVDVEDSNLLEAVLEIDQRHLVDAEDSGLQEIDQQHHADVEDSTLPETVPEGEQRHLVDFEDSNILEPVPEGDQRHLVDPVQSRTIFDSNQQHLSFLTDVVSETQNNEEVTYLPDSTVEIPYKSSASEKETSPGASASSSPRSLIFSALHAPLSPVHSFESLSSGLPGFTSIPAPSSPTFSSTSMEEMPPLPPLPPLRWRTALSPKPLQKTPQSETLEEELSLQHEVPENQAAVEHQETQPKVMWETEAPVQGSEMVPSDAVERKLDLDVPESHPEDLLPELVDSRSEVPAFQPEHAELRSRVLEGSVPSEVPQKPVEHPTQVLEHQPEAVEPPQVVEQSMRSDVREQLVEPRSKQPEVEESHAGQLEDREAKFEPGKEPVPEQSPAVKAHDLQRSEPQTPPRTPSPSVEDDSRTLPVSTMPSTKKHPADDALVQAISGHDRNKLRKVPSDPRPKAPDEREFLLEQIRSQSFNLRHTVVEKKEIKEGPPRLVTNINVAAILEKANAIRQAFAGSDDDDEEDDWSE